MTDPWWKSAVLYQIYPRSFQDSDGDGVGDLRGIVARLPYLVELGVDALWLSPIFASPMADFGYDISDYTAIDPLFGTHGRFRRAVARSACARPEGAPRFRAQSHLDRASLVQRKPRLARQRRNATGTSGATARPAAGRRTTGCRNSAARLGPSMRRPASIITTPSSRRSRTSTGATRRCARRCTTSCASGSAAASTAFAST